MRIISYLMVLIVIAFGVSFSALNSSLVTLNYYFGDQRLPLALLLVSAFVSGSLLGLLVGFWLLLKAKLVQRRLRYRLKMAEREIENLRAIPLQDKV